MKIILLMSFFITNISFLVSPVHSAEIPGTHINISTYQQQDGKIDKTRMFIKELTYIPRFKTMEGVCQVLTITVNNLNCSPQSIGEGGGIWLKAEVTDDSQVKCSSRALDKEREEVLIIEKTLTYQITHRMIKRIGYGGELLDYKGQLIKSSTVTKKIETADYIPIPGKNTISGGWENQEIGCARITAPTIPKPF